MLKRSIWVGFAVLLCVFVLSAPEAYAQAVYGSISGTVTDAQGAGVVGARVVITDVTKGTSVETTTNESGNYTVLHLIPDTYKVHVDPANEVTWANRDRIVVAELDGLCMPHPLQAPAPQAAT